MKWCEFIIENVKEDNSKDEEKLIKQEFLAANIVQINKKSVTLAHLSHYMPTYEEVFEH